MEELVIHDGRVQNLNLHDYKVPTQAETGTEPATPETG